MSNKNNAALGNDMAKSITVAISSGAVIYLLFMYIRKFDWLSTSLWYDSQGFNMVTANTRGYLGTMVSEESYMMNLVMFFGVFVFAYAANKSGPVLKTSLVIFLDGGAGKKRLDWINFHSIGLWACAASLTILDSHLDLMWKSGAGWSGVTESFYMNLFLWMAISVMFSAALILLLSMKKDGTDKAKVFYAALFVFFGVCGISVDLNLDFVWETSQSASFMISAFLFSYVFYGFLSELLLVFSLPIFLFSSGRVLGHIRIWSAMGDSVESWAFDLGLVDSKGRKKKGSRKAATQKSQPRREPPPTRSSNPSRTPTESYNHGNRGRGQPTNDLPSFLQPSSQPQPARMQQTSMQQAMSIIDGGADTEF